MTYRQAVKYLNEFAAKHQILFTEEGTVGFGRECVGLLHGDNYIDYNPTTCNYLEWVPELYMPDFPTSPNAYHKHDCLAVLGRGRPAVVELARWIKELESLGTIEIREYATKATGLQVEISGFVGKALFIPELHGEVPHRRLREGEKQG